MASKTVKYSGTGFKKGFLK